MLQYGTNSEKIDFPLTLLRKEELKRRGKQRLTSPFSFPLLNLLRKEEKRRPRSIR